MAGATFRPNRAGLREYLKGRDYVPALDQVATQIEQRAKADAKVKSGQFRDSIHREHHPGPRRNTVQVVADADGGGAIEQRDRTLGRAAY